MGVAVLAIRIPFDDICSVFDDVEKEVRLLRLSMLCIRLCW